VTHGTYFISRCQLGADGLGLSCTSSDSFLAPLDTHRPQMDRLRAPPTRWAIVQTASVPPECEGRVSLSRNRPERSTFEISAARNGRGGANGGSPVWGGTRRIVPGVLKNCWPARSWRSSPSSTLSRCKKAAEQTQMYGRLQYVFSSPQIALAFHRRLRHHLE